MRLVGTRLALALGLAGFLAQGCGGSSGGGSATPTPTPSPPSSGSGFPPGVYSLQSNDGVSKPAIYQNPNVAGIAVRTRWPTLEPGEGQYDWSYLDGQIQMAKAASKRVSIYVHDVPDWVYADGAQAFPSDSGNIPVPWDPVFLDKWTGFIQAFGARYANEATVAYTRGSTESVTNGWGLPTTDRSGQTWAAYGYTPQRLLQAMQTVVDAFLTAFPQTHHWAEVGTIPFENDISGRPDTYVAEQIAGYGFSVDPDRFGVWRENLSGCIPDPPTGGPWLVPFEHKGMNGAQMLWHVQDGPTRMNPCGISPNDKQTVLMAAVQKGLDYGMPYLEIYQLDIIDPDLQSVVSFAARNLP
jgi:hypothetical protein